jgi:hypothetical protein
VLVEGVDDEDSELLIVADPEGVVDEDPLAVPDADPEGVLDDLECAE